MWSLLKKHSNKKNLLLVFMLISGTSYAGSWDHRGQLSIWARPFNTNDEWKFGLGARYFPELTLEYDLADEIFFDTEFSLNVFINSDFTTTNKEIKLYRLKFRIATAQSETRIGLQQLNFGPARMLRSLKWFDKIDPRDPLGMTDGVYAVRFKYNFLNNSELWLWGLYGNEQTKGYELFPTAKNTPEFGGRLVVPVPSGEMATTVHTRKVDASLFEYRENQFALDGRWDVEIGCWFESVFQQSKSDFIPYEWQKFITIGADYTFSVGNGLYVAAEHMMLAMSDDLLGSDLDYNNSAVMMSYPLNIMDNINIVTYYSWDTDKFYNYIQWQRTWDYYSLNIGLFYYPNANGFVMTQNDNVPMSGYGVQIMFVYNY